MSRRTILRYDRHDESTSESGKGQVRKRTLVKGKPAAPLGMMRRVKAMANHRTWLVRQAMRLTAT
jgi:hypothetical protein